MEWEVGHTCCEKEDLKRDLFTSLLTEFSCEFYVWLMTRYVTCDRLSVAIV